MQIGMNWSLEVSKRFPELAICLGIVDEVRAETWNEHMDKLRKEVYEEVKGKFCAENLKDNPTVRAYRDFYWRLGIDPTKTRPSAEALLRRVLRGGELPRISTLVDAYNLASVKTIIAISGFDIDRLCLPFQIRFAKENEMFTGIGMIKPISLTTKVLVLADKKQVLCIYPYRDSDNTKITIETRKVAIFGYGAPGITPKQLQEAVQTTLTFIRQVSGGKAESIEVFESRSE